MTKRSENSGRPPAGGTVGDEAALAEPALSSPRAPGAFAKTEQPPPRPTLPVETAADLPTIDHALYAVSGELARGGLGRILQARHRVLDRTVAIKEGLRADDPAQARFIREALVTARLQHPSIIPVYEAGRWPTGEPFYAMKLVSGRALSLVIEETSTLEERLALLPNVIAVADAMAYAHSEHIIHRDLKPDNVLVGAFGETVVIDWGLAKDLSTHTSDDDVFQSPYQIAAQGLTMAGAIMGTPEYMAPEQAQGLQVDARSDVYAIGCILYHVLVGEPPFRGTSIEEIITKVVSHAPPALAELPGIPPDLASVVRKAMARSPDARYPTAKGLAEDLRRFQTGQLVSSKQYTAWQLVKRWARRHRAVLAVVAAAVVLLVTTGTIAVTNVVRERAVAQSAQASAEARTHRLILVQARSALDHDPAEALAWLKTYPPSAPNWSEVHEIAIQAQALGPARHILEHPNARVIAFSPDGVRLVSAGRDKEVRIWDVETGGRIKSILSPVDAADVLVGAQATAITDVSGGIYVAREGQPASRVTSHAGAVTEWAFSRDGRLLASGSRDGVIHVVDTGTRRDLTLVGHAGGVTGLAFTPDALVSCGEDRTVRAWNLASGQGRTLYTHDDAVTTLAVDAEGRVASAARDKTIRIGAVAGGAPLVLRDTGAVTRLALADRALVSLDATRLIVWNPTSGKQLHAVDVEPHVALSADLRIVVLGNNDGRIRVVELDSGDERELRGQRSLLALAVSNDGRYVAALGADFVMRVWATPRGLAHTLRGHTGQLRNAAFSPDGRSLATASVDGTVGVWSVATGTGVMLRGHQSAIFDVAFSPDGNRVATASIDKSARVWTLATGESRVQSGYREPAWHPTFSKDGRALYTSSQDGTLRSWDLEHDTTRVSEGLHGAVNMDLSPDGRLLATAGDDGAVRVWDVETWTGRTLGSHTGEAAEARFLPDGRQIVSRAGIGAKNDLSIRLWDVATGTNRIVMTANAPLRALALSPDGRRIAVGSQDRVIHIIELDGRQSRELRGHTDTVKTLRFSPDGRLLASGSFDRSVRLWQLDSGANQVVHLHEGPVWSVDFSPDGKLVASTSTDTTAWVGAVDATRCVPVDTDSLLARIHDITTAEIQRDDRAMSR